MKSTPFSSAFQDSVQWLLALHDVMTAGKSESPEANDLRARLEKPWYEMNEEEQALIDILSADLYTIGRAREISVEETDQEAAEFQRLLKEKKWDAVLIFLREHESRLPSDDVVCIRAICWAWLDQPTVADRFFLEALRLKPYREDLHQAYRRFLQDLRRTEGLTPDTSAAYGPIASISRAIVHEYAAAN